MKKKHLSFLLLSLFVYAVPAFAVNARQGTDGVTCDTVKYRIGYDMSFVIDTLQNPIEHIKEKMLLEIGNRVSHFYSYTVFQEDSLNQELFEKGITQIECSGKVDWQTYKNYPKAGQTTLLDETTGNKFVTVGKMETPEWELCPDSSAVVLGYNCSLATTYFKGRKWSAWYTEDIPLEDGPWKLGGLPGLILMAYDSGRQYLFECSGMQQPKYYIPITYNGKDAEKVSQAELEKTLRRFYADPVAYMFSQIPNLTNFVSTDANGDTVNNNKLPYNPIEREK